MKRLDYTANIATNRDYDPQPAAALPQLPIYDQLLTLADQHDALKAAGRHADARNIKEQAQCILEQWFDDQDARWLADAALADVQAAIAGLQAPTPATAFLKEIVYDRETRDYAMFLDGELVGFARTYHEGEIALDQLVFELLTSGITRTATELDGGDVNWGS